MQLSSSPTSGLLDATSYIFCFMILLFSTIASAQPSMQPNDLGFLYCSVVKGSAGETIDISVIFSVNRQFQLDCSIKFPSEESPPQEYVSTIPFTLTDLFPCCGCIPVPHIPFSTPNYLVLPHQSSGIRLF